MASTLLLLVSLQQGAAASSLTCPLDIKSKTVSTVAGDYSSSSSTSSSSSKSTSSSLSTSTSGSGSISSSDSNSNSESDDTSDSGSDENSDSGSDGNSDSGSDDNDDSGSDDDNDSGSDDDNDSGSESDNDSGSDSDTGDSGSGSDNDSNNDSNGDSGSGNEDDSNNDSDSGATDDGDSNTDDSANNSGASSTTTDNTDSNAASDSGTETTTSNDSGAGSTTSTTDSTENDASTPATSSAQSTDGSESTSDTSTSSPSTTTASSSTANEADTATEAPTATESTTTTVEEAATEAPTSTSTTSSSSGTRRLRQANLSRQLASSSSSGSSGLTTANEFVCNEDFYSQWNTLNLKCGGSGINVASAVAAASCVIYSGTVGSLAGSTCVSVCSFPACESGSWVYGTNNGIASSVYDSVQLTDFMTSAMKTHLSSRTSAAASFLANTTMDSTQQCAYSSEASFDSCNCASDSVSTLSQEAAAREADETYGVITKDATSSAGSVIAPVAQTVAVATVVVSAVAAMAGTLASGAGASAGLIGGAGTTGSGVSSVASAASIMATIDLCQFGVFLNEVNLDGKSAVLSMYGKQMAPAAFAFLPFGKLDSSSSSSRRLEAELKTPDSAVAKYSRTLHVDENWLFVVTLAGVVTILVAVVVFFGIAYVISGFFMSRDEFYKKFADRSIGVLLMIIIMAQNTIGVTATYEIYHSFSQHDGGSWKCILAIASLLFIAIGIIMYGFILVKLHEEDLADVGEPTHPEKQVCQRYGVLYGDYKFKSRYFFAAKMVLSLVSGIIVGFVGASAYVQVCVLLVAQVLFTMALSLESPHLDDLAQKTNTCASIVKAAALALGFFLIEVKTADGSPTVGQNRISMIITGLQIIGLLIVVSRSVYPIIVNYFEKRKDESEQNELQLEDYHKINPTPIL